MRIGKTITITFIMLMTLVFNAWGQRYDRGYDLSNPNVFIKKGTWMFGGTANYSLHNYDNYTFTVIENINSTGYKLKISPAFSYTFKDNMGLGLRVDYGRNMMKLDTAAVNVGDIGLSVKDYHILNHKVTAKAILRNYIPLGNSTRFAMFNETQLSLGFGQGKIMDGHGENVKGSYDKITSFGINLCPGLMAFATDNLAVEFSVNMLGLNMDHVDQTHNQIYHGNRKTTSVNFKINILSIGFGLYYYI